MSRLARELDLTSADFERRQKTRDMFEQEKNRLNSSQKNQLKLKEEEKRKNMQQLLNYDPWGKPGGGAPMIANDKLIRNSLDDSEYIDTYLKFGQPGGGAPIRTLSGNLKVQLSGDPEIRFGGHVAESIRNGIRYKNIDKEQYRKDLDDLIRQKVESKQRSFSLAVQDVGSYNPWGNGYGNPRKDDFGNILHRYNSVQLLRDDDGEVTVNRGGGGAPQRTDTGSVRTKLRRPDELADTYNPWGKPGGGAPQGWVKGKSFWERMGWSSNEEKSESIDGDGFVFQPKCTSDVTAQRMDIRRARSHESLNYFNELSQQAEERHRAAQARLESDHIEFQEHLETYNGFWGRPGNGAPRDSNRRFKLDNLLYTNPLPGEITAS